MLFDFAGGEAGDLPAKQGDQIVIVSRVNADWLNVLNPANQRRGMIPASFVADAPFTSDGYGFGMDLYYV